MPVLFRDSSRRAYTLSVWMGAMCPSEQTVVLLTFTLAVLSTLYSKVDTPLDIKTILFSLPNISILVLVLAIKMGLLLRLTHY